MSHPSPEWVSVSEFARRAGCDRKQVARAVQKGLISKGNDGLLDAAQADGNWRKPNRRTASRGVGQQVRQLAVVPGGGTTCAPGETIAEAVERIVTEQPLLAIADALKLKENYLGRLKQLEYDQKAGSVVLIGEVSKAVGEEYSTVRRKLLAIPAEHAPAIHRAGSVVEVTDLLRSVIVEALEGLSLDGEASSS